VLGAEHCTGNRLLAVGGRDSSTEKIQESSSGKGNESRARDGLDGT